MLTGEIICDRYRLKEKLGQNASRQTWLAIDLFGQTNELVIIKLLALTPQMQWDECKLFEREAQVLKNINHPYIPKYKDYFVLENQPNSRFTWFALVQSYIPGISLQQRLDWGQRLDESQIEKIAVEVLNILTYLHSLNPPLLHRDIKPSNLIWGEDDRIYLVDFGGVQDQAVQSGATFTVVGTYGYVPMEQFATKAVPASDLYALGATLIHLLTGISPADLPYQNGRIQFADRVSIDLGLVNWIGKLTEPNVTERFSTSSQALEALKNKHALSPPITNRKPTGSKIKLKKSAAELRITVGKRGGKAIKAFYIIGLLTPLLWQSSQVLNMLTNHFSDTFYWLVLIVFAMVCLTFQGILLPMYGQTDLYFNRNQFEIRWKLFGFCYWRSQGKTANISAVYEEETTQGSAPIGVTLRVGDKRFTSSPMATVERQWLIDEIVEWLGFMSDSDRI